MIGRVSRFVGIFANLLVRDLVSRHNLRAAWIQSRRGWQDVLAIDDMTDAEFEAFLSALEERG